MEERTNAVPVAIKWLTLFMGGVGDAQGTEVRESIAGVGGTADEVGESNKGE